MTDTTERAEALARLRDWLKPGDTVWTVLRHVSRSGMQRTVSLVVIEDDGNGNGPEVRDIDGVVARALGLTFDRDRGGVKVGGAGMDMGFHLVYELGRALWPEGFGCVGENCRSNDHTNGDRDYTPHDTPHECEGDLATCHCINAQHWHGECHGQESVCKVQHWHRDGGYALRQRWI
jgi:hypothetical protein